MVTKEPCQENLWARGEEGKSFFRFPKAVIAQAAREQWCHFSPLSQMQGWRWKKVKIALNGSIGVPWPPLILLTSGSSADGSHMVHDSPFGRSLVPNRDATHLPKVLWPRWGWQVWHQMVEILFQVWQMS